MVDVNLKNWSVFADGVAASAHDVNKNFAELRSLITTTKIDHDNMVQPYSMLCVSVTSWKGSSGSPAYHKDDHYLSVKLPSGVGPMQVVQTAFSCSSFDSGAADAFCDIYYRSTKGSGIVAGTKILDQLEVDANDEVDKDLGEDFPGEWFMPLPGGGVVVFKFSATSSGAGCDGFAAYLWLKVKHVR
tara:strand:- start:71 stop:631 length:561 start_codon:yes stop_codon:yes gene_type:complete